jgi:hypothetical protein
MPDWKSLALVTVLGGREAEALMLGVLCNRDKLRILYGETMRARQRNFLVGVFFGFIFLMIWPKSTCQADRTLLTATVSDIKYLGDDRYEVKIALENYSENIISIKEIDPIFSLQTEVLGQWARLAADPRGQAAGLSIAGGGQKQVVYIIRIPLDIPDIYMNYRGDINLKFHYGIEPAETGKRLIWGENLYWIIPRTDRWMLREER